VAVALKAVPQQEFHNKCFQQWQHHWAKHLAAHEEYCLKGDPSE